MWKKSCSEIEHDLQIPLQLRCKARDAPGGFCIWVLPLGNGHLSAGFNTQLWDHYFQAEGKLREMGAALAGVDKHHHQEKLISVASSSSPHVLGSQGAAHASAHGWCKAGLTPCRSLSLSINYRGSPRKSNPWLNLVIVNPLPTSECVSYQAHLAAGND